jgi:formate/nitrite transporter
MMTLIGGGELFTGNTALVTAALVEKKTTSKALLKNWFFSYAGNFIGSLLMAYLAFHGGTLGASPSAVSTAIAKTSLTFKAAFVRGILCNWLVSMAVYMASGASSISSKMMAIWFPISAFVALGLDHSIANMFLIPLGMLRGAPISVSDFLLKSLLPVTLGNIVGGAGCVALMYAAVYGSLLEAKPSSKASSTSNQKPSSASTVTTLRGGATMSTSNKLSMKAGSDFLPPSTLERAKVGNNFEKIKIKKDPSEIWTDIGEWAAAIRAGQTNW